MKKLTSLLFLSVVILGLFSCQNKKAKNVSAPDPLVADIDSTVRPQDDFFDYANGTWIKKNPIPDEYSSTGVARLVIDDLQNRLKTINEEAVKNPQNNISKKIAAFWESGMDSAALNSNGIKPIEGLLVQVDKVTDIKGLLALNAELNKKGVGTMFDAGVRQDDKKSDVMSFYLGQGGLGLPDRDYYFNTDEQTTKIRAEYPNHITRMFQLAGATNEEAADYAVKIMGIERELAKTSRKLEALRDPYANYNKFSVSDLKTKLTPEVDWQKWLLEIGVDKLDSIVVGQPEFFKTFNGMLKTVPIDDWKVYVKWNIISSYASYLSDDFNKENFAFYGQMLNGTKKQQPRWKRVLNNEEGVMGEALGQLFVKEFFNEKAKKRYENLVEEIRSALKERIQKLDWMSAATKEKALSKLAKMTKKVGYPDKWKDFSSMKIKKQSYAENIMAASEWWHNYQISKLGKPVDRNEWDMTPQTYNAYYNPSNNEIVLPAGIFTIPGWRDEDLDDAFVYGYAGASTIGHEMTHGFDDQGRLYDENGNLNDWWTKEDGEKFNKRAEVMVKQFDAYEPIKGMHINGKASLGENIADLGGVLLGWDAFIKTEQYKKGEKINGQTPAERYFLGYAYSWLYNMRQEEAAKRLLTDVHSPAKYRVNGPFPNVDAFYKVYQVKPADKMFIPDTARVRIW
ncbi:putative metalloendopeptidase [uncultured Paludibacter sp.]|nr:putative metalloendopeptidase [uncultured Paludibacter sp.]